MKVKIVKALDQYQFEAEVNSAIKQLQQEGNSEFTIQYQPLYNPEIIGDGFGQSGYVIYTALITYK